MSDEFDATLRRETARWLTDRSHDGLVSLGYQDLLDFEIDGRPFKLMDPQRGIRKPRELTSALSIRTVYRPGGAERPYADEVGEDGLLRYKWRGDNPDHAENRALRAAMDQGVPLIWFVGVAHAVYQPVFRATVLRAYRSRCAVCALGHASLLDAAHIVPDRDEAGVASVRNGLSLCKIHHAAYDAPVLGIRPDLVVEIRQDLLDEIDGPMLEHGLKGRHGEHLMVVPTRADRPDPDLLAKRYAEFRAAG